MIIIIIIIPLVVVPAGTPGGTLLPEISCPWAPMKTPKGTNTKVTSAEGPFCAQPDRPEGCRRRSCRCFERQRDRRRASVGSCSV